MLNADKELRLSDEDKEVNKDGNFRALTDELETGTTHQAVVFIVDNSHSAVG